MYGTITSARSRSSPLWVFHVIKLVCLHGLQLYPLSNSFLENKAKHPQMRRRNESDRELKQCSWPVWTGKDCSARYAASYCRCLFSLEQLLQPRVQWRLKSYLAPEFRAGRSTLQHRPNPTTIAVHEFTNMRVNIQAVSSRGSLEVPGDLKNTFI